MGAGHRVKIATFGGFNVDLYAADYFSTDGDDNLCKIPLRWMAWESIAMVTSFDDGKATFCID